MSEVSPPAVLSASASVRVHMSPSQSTAAASDGRVELAGARHEPHLQRAGAPALAHDEVAQQARVRAPVHRAQALRAAPREHLLARAVGRLGGEQAVAHGHDLVPRAGRVEAADERPVGRRAERVLELVAVAPRLDGRHDVVELEALEPADPRQRVAHLLVLDGELALVGQHLPRRARMIGQRRDPLRARLEHLERARLGVAALALRDDRADAVAGDRARDEDDVAAAPVVGRLQAGDAVAAVGERLDVAGRARSPRSGRMKVVDSMRPLRIGSARDTVTSPEAATMRKRDRPAHRRRARSPASARRRRATRRRRRQRRRQLLRAAVGRADGQRRRRARGSRSSSSAASRTRPRCRSGPSKFSSPRRSSGSYKTPALRKGTYVLYCKVHGQADQSMKLSVK